ncbi:unnamed protein product [Zymoseptoria tritici ST99CH_1A5]|uniref:J domain-containing protein n=1 Tax=Zymoseptoria tritici ST99CH_1A5 TaxID=1276529 RepID=A0A1Y6M069_ZYMTR|nr:unnamed protein product [Zymoseptoria tritici ST99CH_1A5]
MAPLATEDYYLLLGVEHTATLDEITKSYRRLSLKLHPDRNKQPNATSEFQRLGLAHETLRDPMERREYDELYPSVKGKGVFYALNREIRAVWVQQEQSSATEDRRPLELINDKLRLEVLRELRRQRILRLEQAFKALKRRINDHKKDIRTLERQIRKLQQARLVEDAPQPPHNKASRFGKSKTHCAFQKASEGRKPELDEERKIQMELKKQECLRVKQEELSKESEEYETKWRESQVAHAKDGPEIVALRVKIRDEQEIQDRDRAQAETEKRKAKFESEELDRKKRESKQRDRENRRAEQEQQEAEDAMAMAQCSHPGSWWPFRVAGKKPGKKQCMECRKRCRSVLMCLRCRMKTCSACLSIVKAKVPEPSYGSSGW